MENTILVYKPRGQTPLETIDTLKQNRPELQAETISYAGRLDPMAEGLVLLLVGKENKKRETYQALPKTYVVGVLFGVATDSYDLLGMITHLAVPSQKTISTIHEHLQTIIGKQTYPYPPYSSKTVNGKPLYYWARKKLLSTIKIPTKEVEIFSASILATKKLSGKEVASYARQAVSQVQGDFRQQEIYQQWEKFELYHTQDTYFTVTIELSCSSGTYMRTIATILGEKIGLPALAFAINRTGIGILTIADVHNPEAVLL